MPNLDGTGPLGQGPRTGRGMGLGRGVVVDVGEVSDLEDSFLLKMIYLPWRNKKKYSRKN